MNTIEILEKARELIADPKHWTTGHYAKSADGLVVGVRNDEACKFCADGALRRVSRDGGEFFGKPYFGAYNLVNDMARKISTSGNLISFNDTHNHAEVLALFDRAIASAKAVGAPVEA